VRVADAVDDHELRGRPGRGERGIREAGRARGEGRVSARGLDSPARPPGRRVRGYNVAASLDEGPRHAARAERLPRLVEDESLGDAAEVEAHPRQGEADGTPCGVEANMTPANARARGGARRIPREPLTLACLAPEGHERSDRRVERAVSGLRDLDRARHHREEFGADGNPLARAGFEPAQLAAGPVVAHDLLERGDPIEGRPCRLSPRALVRGVQHEANRHAHVQFGELVTRRSGGWLAMDGPQQAGGEKGVVE
jgi:hypothetical protein